MITSFFAPKQKKRSRGGDAVKSIGEGHDSSYEKDSASIEEIQCKRQRRAVAPAPLASITGAAPRCPEVEDLISSLKDEGWKDALRRTFDSKSFANLARFVAKERKNGVVYPPSPDTWTALNLCPPDKVKVIVLGQDPYHGPRQAHGLCFSVLPGQQIPPSLRNIYAELEQDNAVSFQRPNHGHLVRWARQGVLMLNTVLSVRSNNANSHEKKGWEEVTQAILRHATDRPCVCLAWGKPAAQILTKARAGRQRVVSLQSSHPSPLSARRTNEPFLGSRCFSKCNKALKNMDLEAIDWNVDGAL